MSLNIKDAVDIEGGILQPLEFSHHLGNLKRLEIKYEGHRVQSTLTLLILPLKPKYL